MYILAHALLLFMPIVHHVRIIHEMCINLVIIISYGQNPSYGHSLVYCMLLEAAALL